MELSELKLITAANLIKLRTGVGLTQAELGAKLNYSDKTISKWERGEAIPDAFVLKQLSTLFGVSVDQLLSSADSWELPGKDVSRVETRYSVEVIIALSVLSVWTACLLAFVILWLFDYIFWQIFLIAMPVSILVLLVLLCVFRRTRHLAWVISSFLLSLFVLLYFSIPFKNPWQIFLVCIPGIAIVFLACNVRKVPAELKKLRAKVSSVTNKKTKE